MKPNYEHDLFNFSFHHLTQLFRKNRFFLHFVQAIPKGTDTFQSLIIKNWITYKSFFFYKCHFLNNFGKTVNPSFNGLTGVNSICSIYFTEDAKKSSTKFI